MNALRDRRPASRALRAARRAFTLIELVVVIVILAILSSLLLAGLAGARQRAKIDKTRSTIRKLHEIVIPLYESYVEKRISPAMWSDNTAISAKTPSAPGNTFRLIGSSVAGYQLCAKRFFAAADMPDLWDDAWDRFLDPTAFDPETYVGWQGPWQIDNLDDPPRYAPNPRFQSVGRKLFGAAGADQTAIARAMAYESAECLQLIVIRGGRAADAVEQFRVDEIGDVDKDGAPEFLDGWGRPISFIRWPVGFVSVLQGSQAGLPPDPMDPLGVSQTINLQTDRAVIPLIYSGGPDSSLDIDSNPDPSAGTYGLVSTREALSQAYGPALLATWQKCGWLNAASPNGLKNSISGSGAGLTTTRWPGVDSTRWAGAVKDKTASDNITNHDLVTK